MKRISAILLLLSTQVHAITLGDAISTVANEKYPNISNELVVENEAYNSNVALARQSISQYAPVPYLFYSYSTPIATQLNGSLPSGFNFPTKFITGLTQENYGFAVDYNIASLPQAVRKIQSIGVVKSAAKNSMEGKKAEFYYNLANVYIELYRAEAMLNLQKKIYETAKARSVEIQKNAQYGIISKKDSLLSESELMQAEMNLENYQNILKNAQARYQEKFKTLHTGLELVETPLFQIAKSVEELKEKITQNQKVIALNQTAKSYRIESGIEKLNLLPKVTVTYRNMFNNPDPSLGFPNYMQTTFAVNANFNLLNVTNYYGSKKNAHESKKKFAEAKIVKASYEIEAVNLWNDTKHQEELILVLKKVVNNAREVYNITKNEVRSGTKPFTEELRAKQDYNTAELNLIEAKLKRTQNIARLKFLMGMNPF